MRPWIGGWRQPQSEGSWLKVGSLGLLPGFLDKFCMAGIRGKSRTGLFSRGELVGMLEKGLEKGPLPADTGLHRMDQAKLVFLHDTGTVAGGQLRAHGGFHQEPGCEVLGREMKVCGHGLMFSRGHENTLFPPAALAALAAREYRALNDFLHRVLRFFQ